MKQKFINAYIDVAERFSQLSSAERLKVGAIVVKDDRIVSIGYNGTPSGWDNCCEYEEEVLTSEYGKRNWLEKTGQLKTKPEVLHAEMNALMKLAKTTESGAGATMFITHAPCLECAKGIYQAGISSVYYKTDYRNSDGITFLEKAGVTVQKLD